MLSRSWMFALWTRASSTNHPRSGAVESPRPEVVVNRLPGREVVR
jgi:hypothetical protein